MAQHKFLAYLVPLLLALLVYFGVVSHGFVWDDFNLFVLNSAYRSPGWEREVFKPLFISANYFRPVPLAMLALELQFFKVSPAAMHIANLLVFFLNIGLVVAITRCLVVRGLEGTPRRANFAALLAGAIYATHPVLVEPVAWISGRFDLLVTFFMLGGLLSYLLPQRRVSKLVGVAFCFFLAALSKESAVVFPLILFAFILAVEGVALSLQEMLRCLRSNIDIVVGVFLAGLCYLGIRYWSLGYLLVSDSMLDAGTMLQHALLAGKSFHCYLQLLFLPFTSTSPFHEVATPIPYADSEAWWGLLLLAACFALVVGLLRVKACRTYAWLLLAILVSLLPYLHVPKPMTIGNNIVQERFLTFPLALFAVLLGLLLSRQLASRVQRLVMAVVVCWILASAAFAHMNAKFWASNVSLWSWTVLGNPGSGTALVNLSASYLAIGHPERALVYSQKAMQANAELSGKDLVFKQGAFLMHARVLSALARHEEALQFLKLAEETWLMDAESMNGAGLVLLAAGRGKEAQAYFERAYALSPGRWTFARNIGLALEKQGRQEEAKQYLELAQRQAGLGKAPAQASETGNPASSR